MAQSVAFQCVQSIADALLAKPWILDVLDRVEVDREAPYTEDDLSDGPAINIVRAEEATQSLGITDSVDENTLEVEVRIYGRGDDWHAAVDAIAVEVHKRLRSWTYPGLEIGGKKASKVGSDIDFEKADGTAGKLTVRYAFQYFTRADDVSAKPT